MTAHKIQAAQQEHMTPRQNNPKLGRRMFAAFLTLTLLGGVLLAGVNGYICAKSKNRIVTKEEAAIYDADCILVLGAGVRDDGTPSHMLEDRLLTGISLYRAGAAEKLLMSGDHSREDYDEVNCMKNYAKDSGVPSADVFMDHAGFSTYDSLYRAKEIFGASRVVIVTQKYHLYRALYVAESLGLEAVGVPADLRTYGGQSFRDLRELLARAKDGLYAIFQPKPTLLGEAISLSGSGDATND